MANEKCACEQFARLEGASAQAYAATFLDGTDAKSHPAKQTRLRCRICGREWERRAPPEKSEGARASLVRVSD